VLFAEMEFVPLAKENTPQFILDSSVKLTLSSTLSYNALLHYGGICFKN